MSQGRSSNQHHLDLERRPALEARIMHLRDVEGLTLAVIAQRVGLSPSRVGQLIKRCREEAKQA